MPALPLRHLLASALLGDQESIESVLLSDVYSSGGSRNLTIDKTGRITQILGYTKQNAVEVKSNTGAVKMRGRGLHHYVRQSGGVSTRQEVAIFTDDNLHWEFRTSTDSGATWVFVNDYGALSANTIPDFAGSGNLLFMTNGVIPPAQWDGTTLTVAGSTQLAAPTFASTGAGTLTGNIAFRVLPMVGNVRKLSSVQSINYSLNAQTGTLSWLADPDVTVTGYEIYRTSGTGQIFYNIPAGSVVGRLTVAFTVGAAADTDAALITGRVLQEYGDAPPIGAHHCVEHKRRMWYFNTDANPRTGYYSDPGVPYSCYLAFNKIDFSDAESFTDEAVGATGNFQNMLVVWQERSIWTLSGDGTIIGNVRDFTSRKTNAQVGTASIRTVTKIPAGAVFTDADGNTKRTSAVTLAYLTPLADIRLFDGDSDEIVSFPKREALQRASYANCEKSFQIHDRLHQEVTWVFPSGASAEPNDAVTWNYRWGTWYSRDWPFAHGLEIETPNSASTLLALEASTVIGGFCYLLLSGFTFNGNAINSRWVTKVLYGLGAFGDPDGLYGKPLVSHRKRWRWVDALFNVVGGVATLTVEWIAGDDPPDTAVAFGSVTVQIPVVPLKASGGEAILAAGGEAIQVQAVASALRAKLQNADGQYLHSRGLRLRFTLSTTSAQWSIASLDTAYQLLTGERRTVQGVN